jgi:hypothetical protein
MEIKKRLFLIPELDIAGRLARMDDRQMEQYIKDLNEFVKLIPEEAKKLTSSLYKKKY